MRVYIYTLFFYLKGTTMATEYFTPQAEIDYANNVTVNSATFVRIFNGYGDVAKITINDNSAASPVNLGSFTMASNNAVTSRLQENPVIGNNRWVLRTPVPSYSGMNLSAMYSRPSTATRPEPVDRDAVLQNVFEN